jgi:Mrp family chromosome partitioning ATPase/capsular polysaccharide biosynthesis protein
LEHHVSQERASLATYLRVLRRRKWLVLLCALVVPAVAFFVSARQEAIYQSSAEVYLNKQDIGSAITGIENPMLFANEDRAAETQVNLASVPAVAQRALKLAGVANTTAEDLLAESSVVSKGASDILVFAVDDPDPRQARTLANAYALAFTQYRGELDSASVKTVRKEIERKLAELEAQGKESSALYDRLAETEQQLVTLETLNTSRASVVRPAGEASQVAPSPGRNAILGLALGLLLGAALALAVEALDTRVRSVGEIGEHLGLPLLARVPSPPRKLAKGNHLAMVAQPGGASAEAFRMLRTSLEFARMDRGDLRVILVASAVEQEGKSTTAANLALAEARSGRRVALVDLDLRQPCIARLFGVRQAHGVTDVALGNVELEDALHPIDLATGAVGRNGRAVRSRENGHRDSGLLDVITAGRLPPDPGEFVGTRQLVEILARLRAAYDLVIVDTPPLLRVGDAMTLSAHADGILVVTRVNLVRRAMLSGLRRQLETAPAPKLGYVATGASTGDVAGYELGYPYGASGYGDRDKPALERVVPAQARVPAVAEGGDPV